MADITNNQIRDELRRILDEDNPKSNTLEKAYEKEGPAERTAHDRIRGCWKYLY